MTLCKSAVGWCMAPTDFSVPPAAPVPLASQACRAQQPAAAAHTSPTINNTPPTPSAKAPLTGHERAGAARKEGAGAAALWQALCAAPAPAEAAVHRLVAAADAAKVVGVGLRMFRIRAVDGWRAGGEHSEQGRAGQSLEAGQGRAGRAAGWYSLAPSGGGERRGASCLAHTRPHECGMMDLTEPKLWPSSCMNELQHEGARGVPSGIRSCVRRLG